MTLATNQRYNFFLKQWQLIYRVVSTSKALVLVLKSFYKNHQPLKNLVLVITEERPVLALAKGSVTAWAVITVGTVNT